MRFYIGLVMRRVELCSFGVLVVLLCGCHRSEPPAPETASQETVSADSGAPAATTPTVAAAREALPRSVAGVSLGMSRSDAEGKLGRLSCHDSKAGYQVCDADQDQSGEVRHLELYINHDHVISVSYESPAPANAWDALNQLIDRYGRPSLSGVRERDRTGRLHEIYGWKDEQSLYSVRFMWRDNESEGRELLGTAIALWDRKGYQQWEAETQKHGAPPAQTDQSQEPV